MNRTAILFLLPAVLALGIAMGYVARGTGEPAAPPDRAAGEDGEERIGRLERRIEELLLERDELGLRVRELEPKSLEPMPDPVPEAVPAAGAESTDEAREAALAELPDIEYHLSANPTDLDLLRRYVRTAALAGEHDRSIAILEKLASANPTNPDLQVQVGRALLFKVQSIPNMMEKGTVAFSALDRFDRAVELAPDHFDGRYVRAVTNYYMPPFLKRLDSAVSDFERLVEQNGGRRDDDQYGKAYAGLAASYNKAGRPEDAKKALDEGLQLFPAHPDLLRLKDR